MRRKIPLQIRCQTKRRRKTASKEKQMIERGKYVQMILRMPPDLKADIAARAKTNDRSITAEIRVAIREHLAQ